MSSWFSHDEGAKIFGPERAAKFFESFGGGILYVPQKPKAKHKIAEAVGFIGMAALCREYGKDFLEIAQTKRLTKKEHVLQLLAQGGKTQCAIAVEVGVTRRWVVQVAKDCKDLIAQKSLELGHSREPYPGVHESQSACGVIYGESA